MSVSDLRVLTITLLSAIVVIQCIGYSEGRRCRTKSKTTIRSICWFIMRLRSIFSAAERWHASWPMSTSSIRLQQSALFRRRQWHLVSMELQMLSTDTRNAMLCSVSPMVRALSNRLSVRFESESIAVYHVWMRRESVPERKLSTRHPMYGERVRAVCGQKPVWFYRWMRAKGHQPNKSDYEA